MRVDDRCASRLSHVKGRASVSTNQSVVRRRAPDPTSASALGSAYTVHARCCPSFECCSSGTGQNQPDRTESSLRALAGSTRRKQYQQTEPGYQQRQHLKEFAALVRRPEQVRRSAERNSRVCQPHNGHRYARWPRHVARPRLYPYAHAKSRFLEQESNSPNSGGATSRA
jgi:hypothetical protein